MLCSRCDGSSDNTTVQLMTEEIKSSERIAAFFIIQLYH